MLFVRRSRRMVASAHRAGPWVRTQKQVGAQQYAGFFPRRKLAPEIATLSRITLALSVRSLWSPASPAKTCGAYDASVAGISALSGCHRLCPAGLAVGQKVAERDGGLGGGNFAAASADCCEPEQLHDGRGMAHSAIKQEGAEVGRKLRERPAPGYVMCPSAKARWRFAFILETAHVERLSRNILAFQHPQHRDQGFDLHVCKAEFFCRLEIMCQHVVLLSPRIRCISAQTTAGTCLTCGRSTMRSEAFGAASTLVRQSIPWINNFVTECVGQAAHDESILHPLGIAPSSTVSHHPQGAHTVAPASKHAGGNPHGTHRNHRPRRHECRAGARLRCRQGFRRAGGRAVSCLYPAAKAVRGHPYDAGVVGVRAALAP